MGEEGPGLVPATHSGQMGHLGHGDACWELDGDAELIDQLAARLLASQGIVLEGQPGAGHDQLAQRVLDRVRAYVRVEVLGPAPDGWHAERLTQLEQELRPTRGLGAYPALRGNPALPRLVFLLPQCDAVHGDAVALLSRMVASGRACVLAVTTGSRTARDGELRRALRLAPERLGPVPLEHARDFLARGLGAPVSERAAYCVWASGAANRSLMKMLAEDWREAGYLHEIGGIWVVGGGEPPVGRRTTSHWQDVLAEMTAPQREAFEMLALGGTLPMGLLMRLAGADAVDGIHVRGHLEVDETIGRTARLKGNMAARAIQEGVTPGRSTILLQRAIEVAGGPAAQPALVQWQLRCGFPVEAARIVDAAEFMLATNRGPDALVLLDAVPAVERGERFTHVQLGALIAAGRLHEARSVLRLLPAAPQGPAGHGSTAGSRWPAEGTIAAGTRAEAELVELVLAAWDGNFRPLLAAPVDRTDLPEHVNWLWHQSVHEAHVMTGRVREGLRADRDLIMLLTQTRQRPEQRERARLGLFDMEMLAGEWENARTTLEAQWYGNAGARGASRPSPFYSGVVRAMTGRYEDAVSLLRPEIPQLQAQGRCDLLPLAHAASALSLAHLGDVEGARAELAAAEVPPLMGRGVWRGKWAAGFLWAQAAGLLGGREAAVAWLIQAADEDHARGNVSQELLALSAAMQLGHRPAVPRLARCGELANGRFADACRRAAGAYLQDDVEGLASAARLLHDLGQPRFAGFLDRRLAALDAGHTSEGHISDGHTSNGHDPAGNGMHPSARIPGTEGMNPEGGNPDGGTPWRRGFATAAGRSGDAGHGRRVAGQRPADHGAHKQLTGRQLAIVEHVLRDASNRQIAARLDLSVRTVESHLYQVYSKLGVKDRKTLKASLAYLLDGDGGGHGEGRPRAAPPDGT